ncbi:MAG: MFS transporter [Steroidobacteraceae bacterium]
MTAAAAASVGMFIGTTPMVSATASLFIEPITSDFGISRTTYSAIMLVPPWIVALLLPFSGRAMDRWGVRAVALPVVLAFGLCQFAMWGVHALWQLLLLFGIIGACGSVHTYTAYTKVVSMWFDRYRGIVIGCMIAAGSSLGAAIVPQFVRIWIRDDGWRMGYVGMGCIILLYGLPIMYFFLREPQRKQAESELHGSADTAAATAVAPATVDEHAHHHVGLTWKEALRTRTLWTIVIALTLSPMAIVGTIAHSFPMLTERGFSPQNAANAISAVYIGGMIGQLSSGFLLDRFNSPKIALPFFLIAMAGVGVIHTTTSTALLIPGAMMLGLGQGSEFGIGAYLVSRFFGLKNYGAIFSIIMAGANVGVGLGLLSMGIVHDDYGNYGPMRYVLLCAMTGVMLLLASLGRYRYERVAAH